MTKCNLGRTCVKIYLGSVLAVMVVFLLVIFGGTPDGDRYVQNRIESSGRSIIANLAFHLKDCSRSDRDELISWIHIGRYEQPYYGIALAITCGNVQIVDYIFRQSKMCFDHIQPNEPTFLDIAKQYERPEMITYLERKLKSSPKPKIDV